MTFSKPVPPSGYTLQTRQDHCPECKATCIAKLGKQKHCNQCGHQWPPIRQSQQRPTRQEVLDGTAQSMPARIIFFRS
jgi:uncharacterized Zn ribbon protein